VRCNANYSESRPHMHIFSSGAFKSPRELFWDVVFVYEINLNAARLFNDAACQDVFAAADDFLVDLQKKITGNSDLRKILIVEPGMRTQAGKYGST